ncbi:ethanolamine ammonia-lyase subunit EutC [Aquibacillus albus]|uniref:Ethanolamine ammonia-lyase small subunit n=1 Tax=Aquibacillus albus TaxID=1168171 RepID=A0ABS2MWB3_9BACI|nr:ethanolamine ammonia-lyase subunit EutC [Aquibacillus albus]MBM7570185.1 ethanolamine ammonia-lyase small subunit [Aquibacillus albus]
MFGTKNKRTLIDGVNKAGIEEMLRTTPARIAVGRTGTRPKTKAILQFQLDHAAAIDAVSGEVDVSYLEEFDLFSVDTCFETKEEYLKRPDKGRKLTDEAVKTIKARCEYRPQVQIVVSDGLSASAIDTNLENVLPALYDSLKVNNLSAGTPFFVKGGRVACMDHIGEVLQPEVLVLLIGERPGLVSANSMSAYICYRPRFGVQESNRNVISNIHPGGTPAVEAGAHIGTLLKKMIKQKTSGVALAF